MKLIAEHEVGNIQLLNEAIDESGEKSMFIEGIFAQAEKKNRNRRIYPKKVLEAAIDKYVTDYVKQNRAMGELNHPQNCMVDPERACMLIKSLEWNGNDVYGRAKILNTEKGKLVRTLIEDGVQLGVSTRGVGSIVEKSGDKYVGEDYTIHAIDCVSNPSGIDCWVDGILENVEFYLENGVLNECTVEEYLKRKRIGNMKRLQEDFKNFMDSLVIG